MRQLFKEICESEESCHFLSSRNWTRLPHFLSHPQGFFLEGARWDREQRCLVDMVAKQLHDQLPIILFQPAPMPEEEGGGCSWVCGGGDVVVCILSCF